MPAIDILTLGYLPLMSEKTVRVDPDHTALQPSLRPSCSRDKEGEILAKQHRSKSVEQCDQDIHCLKFNQHFPKILYQSK